MGRERENHLLTCVCMRCEAETELPDETSDEEMDDDDESDDEES